MDLRDRRVRQDPLRGRWGELDVGVVAADDGGERRFEVEAERVCDVVVEGDERHLHGDGVEIEGLNAFLRDEFDDVAADVARDERFDAREDVGGGATFVIEADEA